jgi:hypothetical protein
LDVDSETSPQAFDFIVFPDAVEATQTGIHLGWAAAVSESS